MTEPVAIRYNFDGYGYQYIDSGSGSDWASLNKNVNGEFLYTYPTDESFDRTASHMAGEYVSHRSLAEEITEGFEALEKIRQLEKLNAELKAYNTELHGIEHDLEMKLSELQTAVRSFFQDFIDIREESDSGRVFAPITISSCRCMMIEPLAEVLAKMRKLSGSEK